MTRWIALALMAATAGPRAWWAGPEVTLLGSPSRDGRRLSFADPETGALAIRELATGSSRVIAGRPAGSREFAYFSSFSPDGKSVAYAWSNGRGFYDLRVTAAGGEAQPRVLYSNEEAGFVQPCAWTPDSKQILTLFFRRDNISQIALVPAAGGPPRVLRSLNWVYPKKMDVSPDGRWIVYDNFAVEGKPERAIFILSADGSEERRVENMPGNYLFPLWTADGRGIIFAGDQGGPESLWSLALENGRAAGEPRRVAEGLGRFLPMGVTAAGDLFYGVRTGRQDVYIAPVADPLHGARRPAGRFLGRNLSPAWSADGKQLAYLSRRGAENFGEDARAIVVLDMATGEEREIQPALAQIERLAFSPDGATLLVSGSDGKGRGGLFAVRADGTATSPLVAEHDAPYRGYEAVWAPDGKSIYYLRGDELRRRRVSDGDEQTILRAATLGRLAISPHGDFLAVGVGGSAIRLTPLGSGTARLIPFPHLTEIAWGDDLYAGRDAEMWAVPLDGSPPRRLPMPPDRLPGVSLSPDGKTIAYAAGREQAEVRSLRIPAEP